MKGLYGKYKIEKADGSPVDPEADYLVLRLDSDKHARIAALAYAESVMSENTLLASDLLWRVANYLKAENDHWQEVCADLHIEFRQRHGEQIEAQQQEIDKYAQSARVIALYLKDYCDRKLPYNEMIAEAVRKADSKIRTQQQEIRLLSMEITELRESNQKETNETVRTHEAIREEG